jgi:hypothetical protein
MLVIMVPMKRTIVIAILLCFFLAPLLAEAQVPTPPDVPTLGPAIIASSGDAGHNVTILSPKNQTEYANEIKLVISIEAIGLLGQFGNVGYSLDGGIINSIRNLGKTVDTSGFPERYWYKTTATASLSFTNLSDGFHSITVYYGWQYPDWYEVDAYSRVDFLVGNTSSKPEIWVNSPSNLTSTNKNSILLNCYLRQVHAMATSATVYYSLDGKNYSISNISGVGMESIENKVASFGQKIENLSDGLHTLIVYAQVYYFNDWLFEENSSVQFTVDTSPPIISELSIANKTYNDQNVPLSFNLNENASWIAYDLDNHGNTTLQGNTTLTRLSIGSHSIVVYANDTLGNMGKSEMIYFTIKEPDTFPRALTIIASVATVVMVGTGLLVYFKKRKR